MRIKNTDAAYCKILNTKISGMKAYITVLLYSSAPQVSPITTRDGEDIFVKTSRVFSFYLKDLQTQEMLQISPNNYWIDRNNNYDNDSTNIDVNMYKEVILEIDITNSNQSNMRDKRWVRECQLILMDKTIGTPTSAWQSETLELISKEIVLPTISKISIHNTELRFKMLYESQEDFNYTNDNLKTVIEIRDIYSNNIISTQEKINSEILLDSLNNTTFEIPKYTSPVTISIQIKNLKDDILFTETVYYNPAMSGYNISIKNVGKVISLHTKQGIIKNISQK